MVLQQMPVESALSAGTENLPEVDLYEHFVVWNEAQRNGEISKLIEPASVSRKRLQKIFRAEVGVREKTGNNDGERVEEYLAVTNLGKGYAWCASFVSWVFAQAGFVQPRTAWSPSLFPKDKIIWESGKVGSRHQMPATGDVFGIWFPKLGRIAHAGFVDEWGELFFISVEGNTNQGGSAEGDGVYRKRRRVNSIYQVANWVDNSIL